MPMYMPETSVTAGQVQPLMLSIKEESLRMLPCMFPAYIMSKCAGSHGGCICVGIRPNAVKYGLAGFNGAGRRFEFKGKFNGADVYDDYAHHPGELKALLNTLDSLDYKRTIVVFQPHTYSRTAALFDDLVEQLKRPDVLLLAEIYAARESNTIGISSSALAERIPNASFYPDFDTLENALRAIARPGDIILTVGAGDVYKIGEDLLKA